MLSAIPANEMAETMRVLAGDNAENAARHFGKHSFDGGDVATAILWTNIAELIGCASRAVVEAVTPPVPLRMRHVLEAAAFQGVRYEDVDSDMLIRETLMDLGEAGVTIEETVTTAQILPFPPIAAYTADSAEEPAEPLPLAA